MNTKEYNGWTNYETWIVNLWLDNDGYFEMCRQDRAKVTAESLKEYVNENNPLANQANFYADMMNAAISEVDFYEIAEAYNADNDEEETEEDAA